MNNRIYSKTSSRISSPVNVAFVFTRPRKKKNTTSRFTRQREAYYANAPIIIISETAVLKFVDDSLEKKKKRRASKQPS
jgi:hypothetical protein